MQLWLQFIMSKIENKEKSTAVYQTLLRQTHENYHIYIYTPEIISEPSFWDWRG